jgi:hypothetical protein
MSLSWVLLLLLLLLLPYAQTHLAITSLEAIHNVSEMYAKVNLCWHPAAADCALQRY